MRKLIVAVLMVASCSHTAGPGEPSKPADAARVEKRKTIARGGEFSPRDCVVPGYVSMLDFYADWCGPCRVLAPELDRLLAKYDRLVLRQVDIIDWNTKAARQANREFELEAIPYLRVYDAQGRFVGDVVGADARAVERLVRKALGVPA